MNRFNKVLLLIIFFLFLNVSFIQQIYAQVVINEFVPDASEEWVEFHNTNPSADYLKTYFLDDDTDFVNDDGSSNIKSLASLDVSNATFPWISISSFLNNGVDKVVLFNETGSIVSQYEYSSIPAENLSIGRYPDQTGNFSFLQSVTKGAPNASPKVDPTPSPTMSPTATPKPTPMSTVTPKPTPKKTPSPKSTSTPIVLGESETDLKLDPSPTPKSEELDSSSATPLLAFAFIIGGIVMVGFAIISSVKKLPKKIP